MPANLACPQLEQFAQVARGSERVFHGFGVDVDRRRGNEFAVDLTEQERALGQRPAVKRGQAFERGLVAHAAVADHYRAFQFHVICPWLRAEGAPEMGEQASYPALDLQSHAPAGSVRWRDHRRRILACVRRASRRRRPRSSALTRAAARLASAAVNNSACLCRTTSMRMTGCTFLSTSVG